VGGGVASRAGRRRKKSRTRARARSRLRVVYGVVRVTQTSEELGIRKGVKKFADALGRRNNGGASTAGGGGISGGAGGVMLGAGVDLPGAEGGAAEALTATSVSGGLGSGRAVDSKIPIADGFEKVHLARLKKTHALMEERIGLLQLHAHEVGSSVGGLALTASRVLRHITSGYRVSSRHHGCSTARTSYLSVVVVSRRCRVFDIDQIPPKLSSPTLTRAELTRAL